jgi:hypothetical protein
MSPPNPMAEWDRQNSPDQFVYKVIFQNGSCRDSN